MSGQGARDPQAVAEAFDEHLHAFHAGLPPDERALLEQVVALAAAAVEEQDTVGYLAGPGSQPAGTQPALSPSLFLFIACCKGKHFPDATVVSRSAGNERR